MRRPLNRLISKSEHGPLSIMMQRPAGMLIVIFGVLAPTNEMKRLMKR